MYEAKWLMSVFGYQTLKEYLFREGGFMRGLSFKYYSLGFEAFFRGFELFVAIRVYGRRVAFCVVSMGGAIKVYGVLFCIVFRGGASGRVFLSSRVVFRMVFVVHHLGCEVEGVNSQSDGPNGYLEISLSWVFPKGPRKFPSFVYAIFIF